ncbi:MAG: thiamine-phosphate kinase [Alcanivoracaceae bacterium]|nr:thiamine-phosphate kinase [Alcanivoracaceae bacterium]
MDEFQLIEHFFRPQGKGPGVLIGPGDDAAVLQPSEGCQLVMTMDTLVSGRHFPEDFSAFDIGWRSLAVNLSDLAAMGAVPRWCLLSLSLPEADEHWLKEFCEGFYALAQEEGITLVGGDMVRGALQITVQATGEVRAGRALLRSGARTGDRICIGGVPGEAALGLRQWQAGVRDGDAVASFTRPRPQMKLGKKLRGMASACIDISDGLLADLQHILDESGRGVAQAPGAIIKLSSLPNSTAIESEPDMDIRQKAQLSGGDDYLLLFTLPSMFNVPQGCYEIGRVTTESGLRVLDENGAPIDVNVKGWTHF